MTNQPHCFFHQYIAKSNTTLTGLWLSSGYLQSEKSSDSHQP